MRQRIATITARGLILAIAVSATWTALAGAQEPGGFAGFGWGTPLVTITEKLIPGRCRWSTTMTTLRHQKRIVCTEYIVEGLGPTYLTLDFIDDAFRGYQIAVPRRAAGTLRAVAKDLLQVTTAPPATSGPSQRRWNVTVDISDESCLPASVCLRVSTH